jgi:galactose mutarotase-like enzyme
VPDAAERFADDREFDFGVPAAIDGRARFALPALGELALDASPEMRHLQFWSQPGKPFICIEPFYGPAGTINTDARGWVPAGSARTFWMRIRLTNRA